MLQQSRPVMGMTAMAAVAEAGARAADLDSVFNFFVETDLRFSPFKPDSELCRLNRGAVKAPSEEMREILALAEQKRLATGGYFDIRRPDGRCDTSGIVKGWAIAEGARLLAERGYRNFAVEIGGDIQTSGVKEDGSDWRVGVRSPFAGEVVKILYPRGGGVATSGSYHQGAHIYDPHGGAPDDGDRAVVSLTVIGPDILDADICATAAFAMGREGIYFIERRAGLEAYAIDAAGKARMTSGLKRYLS
jgi:thiamine biosynthesis lipoprotein